MKKIMLTYLGITIAFMIAVGITMYYFFILEDRADANNKKFLACQNMVDAESKKVYVKFVDDTQSYHLTVKELDSKVYDEKLFIDSCSKEK